MHTWVLVSTMLLLAVIERFDFSFLHSKKLFTDAGLFVQVLSRPQGEVLKAGPLASSLGSSRCFTFHPRGFFSWNWTDADLLPKTGENPNMIKGSKWGWCEVHRCGMSKNNKHTENNEFVTGRHSWGSWQFFFFLLISPHWVQQLDQKKRQGPVKNRFIYLLPSNWRKLVFVATQRNSSTHLTIYADFGTSRRDGTELQ